MRFQWRLRKPWMILQRTVPILMEARKKNSVPPCKISIVYDCKRKSQYDCTLDWQNRLNNQIGSEVNKIYTKKKIYFWSKETPFLIKHIILQLLLKNFRKDAWASGWTYLVDACYLWGMIRWNSFFLSIVVLSLAFINALNPAPGSRIAIRIWIQIDAMVQSGSRRKVYFVWQRRLWNDYIFKCNI